MNNVVIAWIGTGRCEPGDKALTAWAPVVGVLVFIFLAIGLWKIYKDSNSRAKPTTNRSVNLILFVIGLAVAGGIALCVWFAMFLSGACSD